MSNKEEFIKCVEMAIEGTDLFSATAKDFFVEVKKMLNETKTKDMTENGAKILHFMIENENRYNNIFKAKDIGEGLFISARSVSGSMRKLLSDGYCSKIGNDPVCYSLTNEGKSYSFDN